MSSSLTNRINTRVIILMHDDKESCGFYTVCIETVDKLYTVYATLVHSKQPCWFGSHCNVTRMKGFTRIKYLHYCQTNYYICQNHIFQKQLNSNCSSYFVTLPPFSFKNNYIQYIGPIQEIKTSDLLLSLITDSLWTIYQINEVAKMQVPHKVC